MADLDLKAAVIKGVQRAADDPSNSLKNDDVKEVAATVMAPVQKEVKAVIENATNQEPLIQSRNMWTFALVIVGMAASAAGYTFSAEDQSKAADTIIELAKIVPIISTSLLALWGMWNRIFVASKKPLGE